MVVQATKLDLRPHKEIAIANEAVRSEEARWSRNARIAFLLFAAAACWVVPLLIAYLIAF
jgi:hypothetical protein